MKELNHIPAPNDGITYFYNNDKAHPSVGDRRPVEMVCITQQEYMESGELSKGDYDFLSKCPRDPDSCIRYFKRIGGGGFYKNLQYSSFITAFKKWNNSLTETHISEYNNRLLYGGL